MLKLWKTIWLKFGSEKLVYHKNKKNDLNLSREF